MFVGGNSRAPLPSNRLRARKIFGPTRHWFRKELYLTARSVVGYRKTTRDLACAKFDQVLAPSARAQREEFLFF